MAPSGCTGGKAVLFQSLKRALERNKMKSVPRGASLEQIYGTLEHVVNTGFFGCVPLFHKNTV